VYVDSPAVSAVKHGRILIIEGIEKAERGIMPVRPHFRRCSFECRQPVGPLQVLNNLLENREMYFILFFAILFSSWDLMRDQEP
jgi:hypothetical protein